MRTVTSHALFHVEENARAARAAHARLMADPFTTLYVYYKPMRLEAIAEGEPTEGYTLAWPERVPGSLTVDQLIYWFAARSGRVPYLTERWRDSGGRECNRDGQGGVDLMPAKPTKVRSPRTGKLTDVREMDVDELSEYCAWSTESERDLLWQFLSLKGLVNEADEWLRNKAIEEIEEGL